MKKKNKNQDLDKMNALARHLYINGISYREAGKRTGLTGQSVLMHAKGQIHMSAWAINRYHEVFGLPLEELVQDGKGGKSKPRSGRPKKKK